MIGYAVYVCGPNGGYIWHRVGTLLGYTSTIVPIKHGSTTYICEERGEIKATR